MHLIQVSVLDFFIHSKIDLLQSRNFWRITVYLIIIAYRIKKYEQFNTNKINYLILMLENNLIIINRFFLFVFKELLVYA